MTKPITKLNLPLNSRRSSRISTSILDSILHPRASILDSILHPSSVNLCFGFGIVFSHIHLDETQAMVNRKTRLMRKQRFDPSPRLSLDARRSSRMGNGLPSGIISTQTVGQIDQVAPVYINNPNLTFVVVNTRAQLSAEKAIFMLSGDQVGSGVTSRYKRRAGVLGSLALLIGPSDQEEECARRKSYRGYRGEPDRLLYPANTKVTALVSSPGAKIDRDR